LSCVLGLELQDRLVLSARWLVRTPLLLTAASEGVKLRFVLLEQLEQPAGTAASFGYFFWLYVAFVGAQVRVRLCAGVR
jgi:hypothetical protein